MSSLKLVLKATPEFDVDMSAITPDKLIGKNQKQIKAIKLNVGKKKSAVSDLFTVTGKDSSTITIQKSTKRLTHIGHGMTEGTIDVSGVTGNWLGKNMKDGHIIARSNAADWVACGMRGGRIDLKRNVGNFLGAGQSGDTHGMNGGLVVVSGNCGDRVGDRMRRGTIIVLGNAADYCGSRMIAGSVVVLGTIGKSTGFGMRRGTIILTAEPDHMLDTFQCCGHLKMAYLRLFFKEMTKLGRPLTVFKSFGPEVIRYAGDHGFSGQGEIIILKNTKKGSK